MKIVRASRRNLYSITAMTRHFFPYTGFTFSTIMERMQNKNIMYFAAEENGHTVGFADVEFRGKQAKILGLAVLPEFRGKGIGAALVRKCLAAAKKRGCSRIVMFVAEDNAVAQSLYLKFGFKKSGVLRRKLWDKKILIYGRDA
ncbi:MAG: GNAT family N-acetyltransferase [Candidatus Micrarchaeota archaeon]